MFVILIFAVMIGFFAVVMASLVPHFFGPEAEPEPRLPAEPEPAPVWATVDPFAKEWRRFDRLDDVEIARIVWTSERLPSNGRNLGVLRANDPT